MPTTNTLHVDTLLSNVSVKYSNPEYLAFQIFPEVPVQKQSDKYRVYTRNMTLPESSRALGGVAKEVSFEASTSSYILERHAMRDFVADGAAENFDGADLRAATTEYLTEKILLRLENSVLGQLVAANWSQGMSLAATQLWSLDTTLSNPIRMVDTGTAAVLASSGRKPNFGVINHVAWVHAKHHVSVLDRVKYTSAELDEKIMARLFGLENLYVSKIQLDSAAWGATSSVAPILGDVCFLGYKPASPGPLQVSSGYVFRNAKPMVKRYRVEEREADCIEVNMEYTAKIVASLCGYVINNLY